MISIFKSFSKVQQHASILIEVSYAQLYGVDISQIVFFSNTFVKNFQNSDIWSQYLLASSSLIHFRSNGFKLGDIWILRVAQEGLVKCLSVQLCDFINQVTLRLPTKYSHCSANISSYCILIFTQRHFGPTVIGVLLWQLATGLPKGTMYFLALIFFVHAKLLIHIVTARG